MPHNPQLDMPIAAANLSALPKRTNNSIPLSVTFFLPPDTDVKYLGYLRDLEKIGIAKFEATTQEGNYHLDRNDKSGLTTVSVIGEDALRKLAEAGVDFPGANLMFPPTPKWVGASRTRTE